MVIQFHRGMVFGNQQSLVSDRLGDREWEFRGAVSFPPATRKTAPDLPVGSALTATGTLIEPRRNK